MSDIIARLNSNKNQTQAAAFEPSKVWLNVSLNIGGTILPLKMGVPLDGEKNQHKVFANSEAAQQYRDANAVTEILVAMAAKKGPGSVISLEQLSELFDNEVSITGEIRHAADHSKENASNNSNFSNVMAKIAAM